MSHMEQLDLEKALVFLCKALGDRIVTLQRDAIHPESDIQFTVLRDLAAAMVKDIESRSSKNDH